MRLSLDSDSKTEDRRRERRERERRRNVIFFDVFREERTALYW